MIFNIIKKAHFTLFLSIFLLGCSQNNIKVDTDLSNLPKPKKVKLINKVDQTKLNPADEKFISDLVKFKDREQVLANFKFGKKDPFSQEEIQVSKLSSDFKLNGFLTTKNKKYVFVNYLDIQGTITEESIGGVNTDLLPNLAKVLYIDPINKKLTIFYENEKFIFEL